MTIRPSVGDDRGAITALYPDAFPGEDLLPVVGKLMDMPSGVLSLVAVDGETIVGHVSVTDCRLTDADARLALLGPLGVASAYQKQGIGGALVREGHIRLRKAGISHVFVLEDPAYYGRFGFVVETGVAAPFDLPVSWRDAWQSVALDSDAGTPHGTLSVPEPRNDRALWAP